MKEDELYCHEDKTAEPVLRNQEKQSALRAFKCLFHKRTPKCTTIFQLHKKYKKLWIFSYFYVLIELLKTVFVCTIEKLYSKDALITSVSKSQCVKMQIAIMFRL